MSVSDDQNAPPEDTEEPDAPSPGNAANDAEDSPLASALKQLSDALGTLETAVDTRIKNSPTDEEAAEEVQRMADDRARLAQTLDAAEARSERLSTANSEVARRLVGAMETIRGVLDKKEE